MKFFWVRFKDKIEKYYYKRIHIQSRNLAHKTGLFAKNTYFYVLSIPFTTKNTTFYSACAKEFISLKDVTMYKCQLLFLEVKYVCKYDRIPFDFLQTYNIGINGNPVVQYSPRVPFCYWNFYFHKVKPLMPILALWPISYSL